MSNEERPHYVLEVHDVTQAQVVKPPGEADTPDDSGDAEQDD